MQKEWLHRAINYGEIT